MFIIGSSMGNKEVVVDPQIRAMTQLVSSFIQKRSSLNYQINQLKLAQNTKKTCIETKKLRDLKLKNAELVVEIKNSEKILEKIKLKKYIKEKDLSKQVKHFTSLLNKISLNFCFVSEDLTSCAVSFESQQKYLEEKSAYLQHLKEKIERNTEILKKNSKNSERLRKVYTELETLRAKNKLAQDKRMELTEKHSKLSARRRLKRKQTLVIPKLATNAFLLRSKLLLKSELIKQIDELRTDQESHIEQLKKVKMELENSLENPDDLGMLKRLDKRRSTIVKKIFNYRSELELFSTSPKTPFSPFVFKKENDDSLGTDMDVSSEVSFK